MFDKALALAIIGVAFAAVGVALFLRLHLVFFRWLVHRIASCCSRQR